MIDPKLVQMLRCPIAGTPLKMADESLVSAVNEAIERGAAFDRIDQPVTQKIEGGLRSGDWLYPIRSGIPTLIADEAIAINNLVDSAS